LAENRFDGASFAEWNERMALKYDPEDYHTRSNVVIRAIERKRVRAIVKVLEAQPGERVLEVGCGAGNVLECVPHGELVGIDLSDRMVHKARRRLAGREMSVLKADAERLPFGSGSFQRLICTEVLEHVEHPETVLDEMQRTATSDAIIVLSVPNEALINRTKSLLWRTGLHRFVFRRGKYQAAKHMEDEWHLHELGLDELRTLVVGILEIVAVQAIPFAAYPIRYVVKCKPLQFSQEG
jgi:ubiquinone/menaquinone biosynthesis C-methylase UbiE